MLQSNGKSKELLVETKAYRLDCPKVQFQKRSYSWMLCRLTGGSARVRFLTTWGGNGQTIGKSEMYSPVSAMELTLHRSKATPVLMLEKRASDLRAMPGRRIEQTRRS